MSKVHGLVLLTSLIGAASLGVVACSDDGNLGGTSGSSSSSSSSSGASSGTSGGTSGTSGGTSGTSGGPAVTEELSGNITASRTLTANKKYLLKGLVQVKTGATLTIEKGTIVMGDNASKAILLIEPGAKIIAEGTADEPIVFTSQANEGSKRAGDWGGLVLLGNAPVNQPGGKGSVEGILKTVGAGTEYGGTNPDDNSGVLKYVRVEYAGIILSQDNEVNGITFAGVGRGTTVDYVQVRQALDDCFEFFGGTVNAKHLICQANQDDGFDMDNGYQGKLQFLVLQQDPTHVGEDNGFEVDNDATGSANVPFTSPTIFNASLFGKDKDVDNLQYGMLIRRNARGSYNNILVSGFDASLDVRDAATAAAATAGDLSIKSTFYWNAKGPGVVDNISFLETGATAPDKDNDGTFDEIQWFKVAGSKNSWSDPGVSAAFNQTAPVFGPAASLAANATTPPADGFFDASATYIGAFKDANDKWATTGKWAVWSNK
ncbi:MAG: T9SS C-terminal target domain-containing protein [Deltaproteobacteria bacterium]|nr:T9SS C-terminal target domain-containing protein [Deltaproteobacteria bacterium]